MDIGTKPNVMRNWYDDLPYRNLPKPFTHISRLFAIGSLRGATPVSPEHCRVLELGCANGGNLLPMALQFPQSQFCGIDLSPVQIDMGCRMASDLSVSNLELRTADILHVTAADLDDYDYIIVDGVYSWVSPAVQNKILSLCRDHLSENGLAFISFNTYPGWHGKLALRNMLRHHTRQIEDPRDKITAAMNLLAVFPTPEELPGDAAAMLVQRLRHDLEHLDDPATYLAHEYLIDTNNPLYFHEFVERIKASALRYVDDAFPGSTSIDRLPPKARNWVDGELSDYSDQQQYVDFICNISFRRSILCRADRSLTHGVTFDHFRSLYATACCRRADSADGMHFFKTDPGRRFSVEHPGLRRVLDHLVEARPMSISVAQLRELLASDTSEEITAAMFDSLFRNAAVEFTSHPFCCKRDVEEYPYASRMVRHQSLDGTLTNAAHRPVSLNDPMERRLLQMVDGRQSIAEMTSSLQKLVIPHEPMDATDWADFVRGRLEKFAELGLLMNRTEPFQDDHRV